MREIVFDVAASVDGYISGPGGSLEGFIMEGPHVDDYRNRLASYDTVLMGRATYELGFAFGMAPGAKPYPHMGTYVFSRSLAVPEDSDVTVVRSATLSIVDRLRATPGSDIYLSGGSRFAAFLIGAGRVGRLLVKLNPVILGSGIPLFSGDSPAALQLADCKTYGNGVVLLDYDLKG